MKKTNAHNKGKQLERTIRLIHETLKDRPNTKLFSNYKIPNASGRKREIDLLIETDINGIQIKIAVECKAYSKPVNVEKIEAFKGKCDRIPSINKKIFVSQSGFQADATNAANEFGIDLFDVKSVDKEQILRWFPITQLGLRFAVRNASLVIDTTEEEMSELIKTGVLFTNFFLETDAQMVDVVEFVKKIIFESNRELWQINILEFIKNGGTAGPDKKTVIPFGIGLSHAYIKFKDKSYPVVGVQAEIESFLEERPADVSQSEVYQSSGIPSAQRLAVDSPSGKERTDIIITKDKFKLFYTGEDGVTKELETIATFDAKTGKFKSDE